MRTTKILLFLALSISAFAQCTLVYNPFTNEWNCGGGAANAVTGASNLTTAGAIPYVSAPGTLDQDATALFWDAANNYLYAGGYSSPSSYAVRIGGDNPDFKLNVAQSGSAGTAQFYNQGAGVADATKVVIRAGAGQSTTNLQEWQSSAGTVFAFVRSSDQRVIIGTADGQGSFSGSDFEVMTGAPTNWSVTRRAAMFGSSPGGTTVAANYRYQWSSNNAGSGDSFGSRDTGLGRNAAGVVEVNNGTNGTYRDITFRIAQWRNGAEGTCDATTRGQVVMVQGGAGVADTFRVCAKDNADAYAWTALY